MIPISLGVSIVCPEKVASFFPENDSGVVTPCGGASYGKHFASWVACITFGENKQGR
jgi:hypothetical protein